MSKRSKDRNKNARHLINMPDKGLNQTSGPLSILAAGVRGFMMLYNMNLFTWNRLMIDFQNDIRNNFPTTPKEITSMRGNLQKEISKERISLKVFLKAMRLFQVRRLEIRFTFHVRGKAPMVHESHVDFDYPPDVDAWRDTD